MLAVRIMCGIQEDRLYRIWQDHRFESIASIFRGAPPGELPIEAPTHFKFVINLKTAKALGLTIPPHVLALADEVVE
jgi:ABC-type uncharacterized transport system substrate-binding protein